MNFISVIDNKDVLFVIFSQHAEYLTGIYTYSNDIAILHFATPITIGGNIQPATLPPDNSNNYNGVTCVISGWGRTGKNLDILFVNNIYTINRYEITLFNINRTRPTSNSTTMHQSS